MMDNIIKMTITMMIPTRRVNDRAGAPYPSLLKPTDPWGVLRVVTVTRRGPRRRIESRTVLGHQEKQGEDPGSHSDRETVRDDRDCG
jgi:hypothetical protein